MCWPDAAEAGNETARAVAGCCVLVMGCYLVQPLDLMQRSMILRRLSAFSKDAITPFGSLDTAPFSASNSQTAWSCARLPPSLTQGLGGGTAHAVSSAANSAGITHRIDTYASKLDGPACAIARWLGASICHIVESASTRRRD